MTALLAAFLRLPRVIRKSISLRAQEVAQGKSQGLSTMTAASGVCNARSFEASITFSQLLDDGMCGPFDAASIFLTWA
jgi:hypothetical protein